MTDTERRDQDAQLREELRRIPSLATADRWTDDMTIKPDDPKKEESDADRAEDAQ
jgi:hypothetical protein